MISDQKNTFFKRYHKNELVVKQLCIQLNHLALFIIQLELVAQLKLHVAMRSTQNYTWTPMDGLISKKTSVSGIMEQFMKTSAEFHSFYLEIFLLFFHL